MGEKSNRRSAVTPARARGRPGDRSRASHHHSAREAPTRGAPEARLVVGGPFEAYEFTPVGARGVTGEVTRHAEARPPAGAAREPAVDAHRPLADTARPPAQPPALAAAPRRLPTRPTHRRDDARTHASRKFVDGGVTLAVPLKSRGKNKARGESVGQPKPRASGSQRCSNTEETSQWVRTLTARSSSSRTENGARSSALPRRWSSSMSSRSEVRSSTPSESVTRHAHSRARRRSPAPYAQAVQNQALSDVVWMVLRGEWRVDQVFRGPCRGSFLESWWRCW